MSRTKHEQSSANCLILCSMPPISIPKMFWLPRILLLIISAHKIKRKHERGHPCRIPRKSRNQFVGKTVVIDTAVYFSIATFYIGNELFAQVKHP